MAWEHCSVGDERAARGMAVRGKPLVAPFLVHQLSKMMPVRLGLILFRTRISERLREEGENDRKEEEEGEDEGERKSLCFQYVKHNR